MNQTNISIFLEVYTRHLTKAVSDNPSDYTYHPNSSNLVAEKMVKAFLQKSANKDSIAVKRTCKELGISYTYKGIYEFLGV